MARKVITISRFFAGISDSKKEGSRGQYPYARSIDGRSDPASFTILPKTTKESGTTVVDLIKWFEPVGTDMYSHGDAGHIYKRTSAAAWSDLRTVSASHGNGLAYFPEDDYMYYARDKLIGRYGPMTGSPGFTDDFFTDNVFNLDQSAVGVTNTYTTPVAISEAATGRQTFVPSRDPQATVEVDVVAVGTGNWTVTVHDPANTSIASLTITNASMATGLKKFTFASAWRPVIGATYHFHVTSTVADGTVRATTASDLETATFNTYYQILVEDTAFHPMTRHLGQLMVGNGRYIATWDGIIGGGNTNYHANKLELPSGWSVRDLESTGDYLAMLAVRSNTITDFEESMIFLWDGISATFNSYIPINEGVATAIGVVENRLYWITNHGWIYMWNGAVTKLNKIPLLTDTTYLEVNPGAMAAWKGLLRIGVGANTDSAVINHGLYSWGTKSINYPEALTYDGPASHGHYTGTGKKIGAVGARGNTFFMSWKDDTAGTTYGVDVITTSAAPYTTAEYNTLIIDNGVPWKEKGTPVIVVSHKPLLANESVQIGYDFNQSGTFTPDSANTTVGDTQTRLPLDGRWKELQVQVLLAVTTTAPSITSIAIEFDDLEEEELSGEVE